MNSVGIDISKDKIVCGLGDELRSFNNSPKGFAELMDWANDAKQFCMEATGRYHLPLANFVHQSGKKCLVVNPGLAKQYLGFVNHRAKTDNVDALSLARMAEKEGDHLRAYRPVPEEIGKARDLLTERKALVETRVALTQTASQTGDPGGHLAKVVAEMRLAVKALEKQIHAILSKYPAYENLLSIPCIGPMSASILVCALERGEFLTSDSLVAFAGLDPRASESGKHKGRRRLSHHGDAQMRTILFMAARIGSRHKLWKPYYQNQLNKGLSKTEATVILSRKLLRTAWGVYKQNTPFKERTATAPIDNAT